MEPECDAWEQNSMAWRAAQASSAGVDSGEVVDVDDVEPEIDAEAVWASESAKVAEEQAALTSSSHLQPPVAAADLPPPLPPSDAEAAAIADRDDYEESLRLLNQQRRGIHQPIKSVESVTSTNQHL